MVALALTLMLTLPASASNISDDVILSEILKEIQSVDIFLKQKKIASSKLDLCNPRTARNSVTMTCGAQLFKTMLTHWNNYFFLVNNNTREIYTCKNVFDVNVYLLTVVKVDGINQWHWSVLLCTVVCCCACAINRTTRMINVRLYRAPSLERNCGQSNKYLLLW